MQDLVAAFIAAFHPTQGNIVEWSSTISDSISLQGVEFSSLPSGLHSVEEDVIYFRHDSYDAVSVFRRRRTGEEGRKGIRMEAVGVLVARSSHTRPWLHVPHLKEILDEESLHSYFDSHKSSTLSDSSPWRGTASELSASIPPSDVPSSSSTSAGIHPLLHAHHLWDVIGPSFVTIWKFVLARRRVMVYTHAPAEASCHLGRIMVELAFSGVKSTSASSKSRTTPVGDDSRPPPIFMGIVGLIDIQKLQRDSDNQLGWIACTTDKIYLEKPELFDLLVDLTTITSANIPTYGGSRLSPSLPRPTLYVSRHISNVGKPSGSKPKLQFVRPTFSDLRVWGRCDKSLKDLLDLPAQPRTTRSREGTDEFDSTGNGASLQPTQSNLVKLGQGSSRDAPASGWSSVLPWRLYSYEDVCLMCTSLWMGEGGTCNVHGVREASSSSGRILLEGDDDTLLAAPPLKQKATQKPMKSQAAMDPSRLPRTARRWSTQAKRRMRRRRTPSTSSNDSKNSSSSSESTSSSPNITPTLEERYGSFDLGTRQTMFLLDAFEDLADGFHTAIDDILKSPIVGPISPNSPTIYVSQSQMTPVGLSVLSELDSKLMEWLAEGRARSETQEWRPSIKVKRGWRDLFGAVVGW